MQEATLDRLVVPAPASRDVLSEILRAGAQRLLTQAIVDECQDFAKASVLISPMPNDIRAYCCLAARSGV